MKEFRAKLGEDGRIVIPAAYRKMLHLEPGETLIIKMAQGKLQVMSIKQSLKQAQHQIQEFAKGISLVKKLKDLRQEDNCNG